MEKPTMPLPMPSKFLFGMMATEDAAMLCTTESSTMLLRIAVLDSRRLFSSSCSSLNSRKGSGLAGLNLGIVRKVGETSWWSSRITTGLPVIVGPLWPRTGNEESMRRSNSNEKPATKHVFIGIRSGFLFLCFRKQAGTE